MLGKIDKKEDYKDLEDALVIFGFKQERAGIFYHKLLNRTFDFSACSFPGAINVVFDEAGRLGYDSAKQEIREFLGL